MINLAEENIIEGAVELLREVREMMIGQKVEKVKEVEVNQLMIVRNLADMMIGKVVEKSIVERVVDQMMIGKGLKNQEKIDEKFQKEKKQNL